MKKILLTAAAVSAFALPATAQDQTVTLSRFFGACENAGTDFEGAVGEACIIQSLINAASAADNGVTVETREVDWGAFYDQMKAAYAAQSAPDIHVMHRSRLIRFTSIGAVADLTDDLVAAGIDPTDWAPSARDAASYNGQIYAVPLDIHANLWHVNLDMLEAAGLTENGEAIIPSSPEELLAQAAAVKDATGMDYLAAEFADGMLGVRFMLSMVWQQGADVFNDDGAQFDTDEARTSIAVLTELMDTGSVTTTHDYASSEKAFINGETAILVNGTWVVDAYAAQAADPSTALQNYTAYSMPVLFGDEGATWADSHMWVIPASLKENDPEKYQAALRVLAFLNENNLAWAKTGHMAVRTSVLESDEYAQLPSRANYALTAAMARDVPATEYYGAIQDAVGREVRSIWLTGKSVDDALADIDDAIEEILDN